MAKVLIIIDVQRGFVKEATEFVPRNIEILLAKERYDKVIQTKWENYRGSRYEKDLGYFGVSDPAETELCIKSHTDCVISRCAYSCVNDELLKVISKDDDIDLCGLETDACVLGTCFALWDLGYRFHVIEQCTGTNAKELHEASIRLMRRQFGTQSVI